MKWTSEKPTKPGWYWYWDTDCAVARVLEVYQTTTATRLRTAELGPVNYMPGEWSGPIEEPTE